MVSLIIGMVCVAVVTLLLLGASIVEPRLIHYYDVGVVCAVCVLGCACRVRAFSGCLVCGLCVAYSGTSWSV